MTTSTQRAHLVDPGADGTSILGGWTLVADARALPGCEHRGKLEHAALLGFIATACLTILAAVPLPWNRARSSMPC